MRHPQLFVLILAVLCGGAPERLAAQDEDPAQRQHKITILSYQRLAEMQKQPALVRAVGVVAERLPEFFDDRELAALVSTSVASTKALPPGVTKEDIIQARAQLQVKGRFERLKDKELRESLIEIIWKQKMPTQIAKLAGEAAGLFGGARQSALGRACVANMKVLWGAMEMYALDKNRPPPVASIDQLMSELTGGGYMTQPIRFCALDKTTPLVFTPSGSSATVSCPNHGDPQHPSPTVGGDQAAMAKAAETNPVIWATMQQMKK